MQRCEYLLRLPSSNQPEYGSICQIGEWLGLALRDFREQRAIDLEM